MKIGDFIYIFGGSNANGDIFTAEKIDIQKRISDYENLDWK